MSAPDLEHSLFAISASTSGTLAQQFFEKAALHDNIVTLFFLSYATPGSIICDLNADRYLLELAKNGFLQWYDMKVYLDDERETPVGWVRVYWPNEAVELLCTGDVIELSLDHDLGDDERGTGYDVVLWIEEAVAMHGFIPPLIRVHSANSSAREKMEAGIAAITRLQATQRY